MEYRSAGIDQVSPILSPSAIDQETLWQMSLSENEDMGSGQYPERPGEPDCSYYMRTGICRFGMTCRFNHPADRNLVVATAIMKGGYPERPGQPECQFYLKTGTCKFGATCKFHHPREIVGISGRAQLNILGYPMNPNEKECTYYLKTGLCKFGSTCKFHHPQPTNGMIALRGASTQFANLPMSRAWPSPSNFAPLILPQGMVQVPSWNSFSLGSTSSIQNQQISQESGTGIFPERPDEPVCQFYMKTGDCKFGAACRFHHPKERYFPPPTCLLTPLGLPLRPGEPMCIFYSRYGICKFGPSCKFDHPIENAMDVSPMQHLLSSSTPPPYALSSEGSRRLSSPDLEQIATNDDSNKVDEHPAI